MRIRIMVATTHPRTRGGRHFITIVMKFHRHTPAHAWSIRRVVPTSEQPKSHTRARVEYPCFQIFQAGMFDTHPRTRGAYIKVSNTKLDIDAMQHCAVC